MISSFFISVSASILSFIISVLPTGSLPIGVTDAIVYFWGIINAFSYVIPVDTLLQAMIVILSVEAFLLFFHLVRFVYKHIPILGR